MFVREAALVAHVPVHRTPVPSRTTTPPGPIGARETHAVGRRARSHRALALLADLASGVLLACVLADAGVALADQVIAWLLGHSRPAR